MSLQGYVAPAWLPGGHLQTIWPALRGRRAPRDAVALRRRRIATPDGDFVDFDFAPPGRPGAPLLVLLHGLEGSARSHYAQAFALAAARRGWHFVVPHFRGCSGQINLAPRAYHSGDFQEVGWMLEQLRDAVDSPRRLAVGVSLGGNALLRWAAETGAAAAGSAQAVAAVSAPLDLAAAGRAIDRGLNRQLYARWFLRTMRPRALAKWDQFPGLFDRTRVERAVTLRAFDDAFTAPLHGFAGVDDYWARASARPHLRRIRIPALAVNARNDPFVPATSLPTASEVDRRVTLWQPAQGGHVGFPSGRFPDPRQPLPESVCDWLNASG